jgi:hypothetical protein
MVPFSPTMNTSVGLDPHTLQSWFVVAALDCFQAAPLKWVMVPA